jgi:plasmid stabilization system protein ParE
MKRVTFHEEAAAEVNEGAKYYEERVLGLGRLFLTAVEEAAEKVQANPEAFQLVGDEIRHKLIQRFPYSLLYVIEPDRIRIIAVAHQKRRPGYWSHRL